ncbi:hypothetical protein FC093_21970 [Ilyomonas limi]|uniref:Uncharacterized protein n=1 Tax=Ilyomonas limi TaxID=2575867 RepID=A0A4U3KQX6_9BACT|nr:hypothetical protein [Ilyomonas limi]TKK64718.1 hypothetical protein FC093_21970 [Ilyomonas limi]
MQKVKRFLVHPVTICILFCGLIISGQSNGAFYIFILLLGLSHGVLHSLLGIGGIMLIIASLYLKRSSIVALIRLAASVCFILSLLCFFMQPGGDYNYPTFRQFVPLVVLIIFLLALLLFILKQFQSLRLKKDQSVSAI